MHTDASYKATVRKLAADCVGKNNVHQGRLDTEYGHVNHPENITLDPTMDDAWKPIEMITPDFHHTWLVQ